MLGAGLAGVLVATLGAQNALLVDSLSFGLSALVLAWATVGIEPATETDLAPVTADADPPPYLAQLREGWDFLRRDPLLLGISVMVAVTNLLDAAWSSVLMPVWSIESGEGAAALGLLFAVMSGSSALGAVCAATIADRLPRFRTYLFAFLLCGLPRFAVFVVDTPMAGVIAVFVVAGFASGFINPVLGAVMFERIPAHLVGRVSSLTSAMCWALMPLGGLVGGVLFDTGGLALAMGACGLAYLAATMLPAVDPRWREMDRRPEKAEPATVS
jgi:MFS family permease